jgi:transposase-like protein
LGRYSKYEFETKTRAVRAIINGKSNDYQASRETGASRRRIREWVSLYKSIGEAGLRDISKNKRYTRETKIAAIKEYIVGGQSVLSVCEKYQIRSTAVLREWIKKYNGCEHIKTTGWGVRIVTKGRGTTFNERVEIVKACIEQDNQYSAVAEAYNVSYQQVWNWTNKYRQAGVEGLRDRRGKRNDSASMSETDKLRAEIKLREAENLRLRMENDLLKKLAELERGEA